MPISPWKDAQDDKLLGKYKFKLQRDVISPTKIATIKNTENKCWWECGEIRNPVHSGGNVKRHSCWGTQFGGSQNLRTVL